MSIDSTQNHINPVRPDPSTGSGLKADVEGWAGFDKLSPNGIKNSSNSINNCLLEVSDLQVAYGGIQAVKGISLQIAPGELVALIGSNGAGKSTTLKTLAGLLQPVSGEIQYDGNSLKNIAAHQRVSMGIALVPEGRGVFARLTVAENLQMGAYSRNDKSEIASDLVRMYELFPRLAERKDQLAGTLSGGEQQMVAMARALMSRPRLLMLDEPSMGLAPLMVKKIFETISDIAAQGMSILLVEQNAKLALQVAQRGYVMESGAITLSDEAKELLGSEAVQRAYLGG
ncbi:MAG: ABC transporter ATP-binding protein [Gallionella sp.]|nr:ABC transporter ATP-binding protein [Gallionella sp.]